MNRREGSLVTAPWLPWGIALLGLSIRLAIAPWGGHTGDIIVHSNWARAIQAAGWLNVYTATPDANYPPLGTLIVAWSALFPVGSRLWLVALKLPGILADGGIMWLVWRAGSGRQRKMRLALLASVALNPALIIMSGWWGQFENVYALGALASVLLALDRRFLWAGVALGAAMLVKMQGIVVAPVVGSVALPAMWGQAEETKNHFGLSLAALGAGFLATIGLGMAPFIAIGQGRIVALRSIALLGGSNWLTINAHNMWYLITNGAGNWAFNAPLLWPDSAPVLGGMSARLVGLITLSIWVGSVLLLAWHRRESRFRWLMAAALLYLGVFYWPTSAADRYAFGAVVFGAVAVASAADGSRRWWLAVLFYAMITIGHAGNLLWVLRGGSHQVAMVLAALIGGAACVGIIALAAQGDR